MTKDWEIKTLGEVCKVIAGQSPEGKYYNSNGDGLGFYQGKKEFGDKYVKPPRVWTTKVTKEAQCGDILMSVRAPVGPTNFATEHICIGRGLAAIRSGKDLDSDYLYYFFKHFEDSIQGNEGAVFNSINKAQIERIEILIPPLTEQKRIVKILDDKSEAIEDLKRIAKEQLASAKELFESRSEELLTNSEKWQKKTIDDVCTLENGDRGKNYPSNAKLQMEGIPFVSAGNLQQQGIELKGRNFLTDKQYSLLRSGKFTNGDILFCLRGSLGKYAVVQSIDKGAIASSLVIVRPKELVSKEYIMSYFGSGLCKKMVEKYAGGAAQPNLGAKDLKKFLIYLPTLKEQKVICDELATLKKQTKELEQVFRRKITDLEELKKSYLQEAFSGKL